MKKLTMWMIVLVAAVAAAGCGYKLAGGGYIRDDVTRVAVAVFENNSSESRAGVTFTNELIREITAKSDTQVVDESNSTRVITGVVKSITFSTLSRSSTEDVTERRVTAVVDVKLSGPDGEILWSIKGLSANESYTVEDDTVDDEANKSEAVDTIAERVAERLVSQMQSNF
ncbi:MAG: LPS assembly lipoprotein LptE [Desulfobacterales bacterium]|nr:LPS assembly lipoprotein LptE [Desulfobacterales bacterium]